MLALERKAAFAFPPCHGTCACKIWNIHWVPWNFLHHTCSALPEGRRADPPANHLMLKRGHSVWRRDTAKHGAHCGFTGHGHGSPANSGQVEEQEWSPGVRVHSPASECPRPCVAFGNVMAGGTRVRGWHPASVLQPFSQAVTPEHKGKGPCL